MSAIRNITIGRTERLYKPVGYTMLANLVNIVPFCLSIEAIRIIFRAFNGGGQSLDTTRLWCIFGCMTGYIAVMVLAERAAYRANFRGAYEMSASGRISLAEHLRKLSLGFLGKRDPGDLSSMLITDFTMAETGISHYLPQLMGALVMPALTFALICLPLSLSCTLVLNHKMPIANGRATNMATAMRQSIQRSETKASTGISNAPIS